MIEVKTDLIGVASSIACKRDDHNGQATAPDVNELPQTLRQPRTEMDNHDGRLEFDLRISASHCRYTSLMEREDAVYVGMGM